ncbi:MAG: type IV pilus assembly protein PilM [Chthonomonadaceae bacterium]|nr:type IV pilus assembly protein PilM [Chthonomonadaceae bacterium]
MSLFRTTQNLSRPCTLGLDIGRCAIKAVLLEEDDRAIHVKRAWCVPTPPDALDQGVLLKKREVGELLKKIVRQCEVPLRTASVSLPMAQALVRWIDLPRMDEDALEGAARFEARKYLPYPAESAEIVMTPMQGGGDSTSEMMKALLTAIPTEVVTSRAEALEFAGLGIDFVEIESFPLLRTHRELPGPRAGFWRGCSKGFLMLGEESSSMVIVQGGVPVFVRSFNWGSSRLKELIVEMAGCAPEEAGAILERRDAFVDLGGVFAWGEPSVRRFCEGMAGELQRLDREIARLISYYRSLFPERSYEGALGALTLSGGTANLTGLPEYFTQSLQIPTSGGSLKWERFGEVTSSAESVLTSGASYSVAAGLALGALQRLAQTQATDGREYVWRRAG